MTHKKQAVQPFPSFLPKNYYRSRGIRTIITMGLVHCNDSITILIVIITKVLDNNSKNICVYIHIYNNPRIYTKDI